MKFHKSPLREAGQDRHGRRGAQEIADDVWPTSSAPESSKYREAIEEIKQMLNTLLAQPAEPIRFAAAGPTVIMVAGVNGCGKTTSIAKLA